MYAEKNNKSMLKWAGERVSETFYQQMLFDENPYSEYIFYNQILNRNSAKFLLLQMYGSEEFLSVEKHHEGVAAAQKHEICDRSMTATSTNNK